MKPPQRKPHSRSDVTQPSEIDDGLVDMSLTADAAELNDLLDQAVLRHQAGDFEAAERHYRAVLTEDPSQPRALFLMAMLLDQTGEPAKALPMIELSLAYDPNAVPALNCLGQILLTLGRASDAEAPLKRALELRPGAPAILNNLGLCLLRLNRPTEALARLTAANEAAPEDPAILRNLTALTMQCQMWQIAAVFYRRLLTILPDDATAWNDLGVASQQLEDLEAAKAAYQMALALRPEWVEPAYNLGCALAADGDNAAALKVFNLVLAQNPNHGPARLAACFAALPIVPDSEAVVTQAIAAFDNALESLEHDANDPHMAASLAEAIGGSGPFFLPYLLPNGSEASRLQRYGALCHRLLGEESAIPAIQHQGRIRIAIVSGYFYDHTIWSLFLAGWLDGFDRDRFELIACHTGQRRDGFTDIARENADCFLSGLGTAKDWQKTLTELSADVILYPEIGMDPIVNHLAALRLAPVQLAAWGHPVTSGYQTIDAFITGAAMEGPDPTAEGPEKRVALPGIGHSYLPPAVKPATITRETLGLRATARLFWLGHALFKFTPQSDALWPHIADATGDCQFLFIRFARSEAVTRQYENRLRRAFSKAGLDPDRYIVILPSMKQSDFLGAAALCDVVLDPPGWSGGRSTLDLLAIDPVLVTCPGLTMRSRHTAGILETLGMADCICADLDDYVATAARLANDDGARQTLRHRLSLGREKALDRSQTMTALQDYIAAAVSRH